MADATATLPANPAAEFLACAADPAYFIHNHVTIEDAHGHGDGGGTIPFRLWPCQVQFAYTWVHHTRIIALKPRQLGISWECDALMVHDALFNPGHTNLIFSKGQKESNEQLYRCTVIYERLPTWLKAMLPALAKRPNTEEIRWANGSRILSFPASGTAGRSYTASNIMLDEAAFMPAADDLYTAAKPTVDAGGRMVIVSTANGLGNFYHATWTKAVRGDNGFKAVFFPWWARPGRDKAWYVRQLAEYTDPIKVKQEYPATATEAFIASGSNRFPAEWIEAQAPNVRTPLAHADLDPRLKILTDRLALKGGSGHLWVYENPRDWTKAGQPDRFITADVAEGINGGDYDAATGWQVGGGLRAVRPARTNLTEWFTLHGHWEPDEYADLLNELAEIYRAWLLIERNNHGHAVLVALKIKGCRWVWPGHDERPGWLTDKVTKPQMIDAIAVLLRDQKITIRSQAILDELQVYIRLENGKTSAPDGYHDDLVMDAAIGAGYLAVIGWRSVPVPGDLPRVPGDDRTLHQWAADEARAAGGNLDDWDRQGRDDPSHGAIQPGGRVDETRPVDRHGDDLDDDWGRGGAGRAMFGRG